MLGYIFGAFLVLHGLVHMLYFGQSQRLFELKPGLAWPDGSWAFSTLFGDDTTRVLASAACVLAAIGFVVGGAGVLAKQAWWRPIVMGTAAFSVILYALFWNGRIQSLDDQGMIGLLIGVALLVAVLIFHWPRLAF
jgi:hypothetical protein